MHTILDRLQPWLSLDFIKGLWKKHDAHGHCQGHSHAHGGHCDGHTHTHEERTETPSSSGDLDVERGVDVEEIWASVAGMDCSICGNQVKRKLRATEGVQNCSISIDPTREQVEFSIDPRAVTADNIIRELARGTKFRCVRLTIEDQTVDILASGGEAKRLKDLKINGIKQVYYISKKTVRLIYDPSIVGARTLLRQIGLKVEDLAPHFDPAVANGKKSMYEKIYKTTAAALLTIPVATLAWADTGVNERTQTIASLILATFVQLIAVPDFYRPALSTLFYHGDCEMDLLVVISITAAYGYSVVALGFRMAGKALETKEFFETSTLLITLVLFGRMIATWARYRAVSSVSFRSLQSTTATIVEDAKETDVDARLLQHGDIFRISPHSTIPTDGEIINGSSEVDESMLTGECVPVSKKAGSSVSAGTMNGTGALTAKLTRLPGNNTVTDIVMLVEKASRSQPKIQDYADKVSRIFVPVVSTIAIICLVVWIVVGFKVRNYGAGKAIPNAITYCVALLAVSCPCALGLAVPMVVVIAGGIAARKGVVIKSAHCTERARKVTDVVFDKTGTLTESGLSVVHGLFELADREEAIGVCKAVLSGTKHPVSIAVAKHLNAYKVEASTALSDIKEIPGEGIRAIFNNDEVLAGRPQFTNTESNDAVVAMVEVGMTSLVITRSSQLIAAFGLRPCIRPEASKVIDELKRRNIDVHVVSGDQHLAVKGVADRLKIPIIVSQCSPEGKKDYIKSLMDRERVVLFIGDGTNDAVAVKKANVGIQVGGGSEITGSAADVVLLSGLEGILFLLDISHVSYRRIYFNFVWCAVYNIVAILFASGAFVKVRIEPIYAGLGELVSVLPVLISAATMHLAKVKTWS